MSIKRKSLKTDLDKFLSKPVKIPFKYNLNRGWSQKSISLKDIYEGLLLCNKLGFIPSEMFVSENDYYLIRNFSNAELKRKPYPKFKDVGFYGITITRKKSIKDELLFICNQLYIK